MLENNIVQRGAVVEVDQRRISFRFLLVLSTITSDTPPPIMASSDLWQEMQSRLQSVGTRTSDIQDCTPLVLQQLLQELGFSALQCAKLQTEWTRRGYRAASSASSKNAAAESPNRQRAGGAAAASFAGGTAPPIRVALSETSAEFVDVAQTAADFLVAGSRSNILAVERVTNTSLADQFDRLNATLVRSAAGTSASLPGGRATTSGAPRRLFAAVVPTDLVDGLCSQGLGALPSPGVLNIIEQCEPHWFAPTNLETNTPAAVVAMSASGISASSFSSGRGLVPDKSAGAATATGCHAYVFLSRLAEKAATTVVPQVRCKLVIFDVLVGNCKVVPERDARQLATFAPAVVTKALRDEGFDAVQVHRVQPYLPDAFMLFDAAMALPRYVVTFTLSGGFNGFDSEGGGQLSPRGGPQNLCGEHRRPLEFWSMSRRTLLCSHCLFVSRPAGLDPNDCVVIAEAAAHEGAWLRQWTSFADAFIADSGRVLAAFDAAMESAETSAKSESDKLAQTIVNLKALLDELLSHTTNEIRRSSEEQCAALQRSMGQVLLLQNAVEELVAAAKAAINSEATSPIDILHCRNRAADTLQHAPVHIPQYVVPQVDIRPADVVAALQSTLKLTLVNGPVDLPEVIDVSKLVQECDERRK